MTRKQDEYLSDDRATQCGAYIKHRMPELTDAQARDAATMALSWVGDNPLWRKDADPEHEELRRAVIRTGRCPYRVNGTLSIGAGRVTAIDLSFRSEAGNDFADAILEANK